MHELILNNMWSCIGRKALPDLVVWKSEHFFRSQIKTSAEIS